MFFACQSSVFESPWSTELESTAPPPTPTCLFESMLVAFNGGIWREPPFFFSVLWLMQGDVETSGVFSELGL